MSQLILESEWGFVCGLLLSVCSCSAAWHGVLLALLVAPVQGICRAITHCCLNSICSGNLDQKMEPDSLSRPTVDLPGMTSLCLTPCALNWSRCGPGYLLQCRQSSAKGGRHSRQVQVLPGGRVTSLPCTVQSKPETLLAGEELAHEANHIDYIVLG